MSELTADSLLKIMRDLNEKYPPPPPDPFGLSSLFRPRFGGLDVIVEPEVPKITISKEAAELVGPEFAANMNLWLLARFGFREPVAKMPLILYGTKVVMNSRDYSRLMTLC